MTLLSLTDTQNDVAALLAEMEQHDAHFHNRERWLGKLAVQTATDWADDTLAPYRAISGANVYGAGANDEALVLGTADTPIRAGMTLFDVRRLLILDVSHDTVYKLRLVWGTGTMADAITAGQYSEVVVLCDSTNPQLSAGIPVDVMMPRLAVDTQIWVQAWSATDDAWADFLCGIHEYAS